MKSLQTRLHEQFERIASEHDCELVERPEWANTGQLLALKNGEAYTIVARLHYAYADGISKIWFNEADSLEPWLDKGTAKQRRNPDVFYFNVSEEDKVRAIFTRWAELLR